MGLFSVLHNASQSLLTSGSGMQVTTNNVANANTPGYAKQTLGVTPQGTERAAGGLLLGRGVLASTVMSAYDSFSQAQVFGRLSDHSYSDSKTSAFESIESLFTDGDAVGIGGALYDFFDSFAELEVNPSLSGARLRVLQAGENLASFFSRTATDIDNRQLHADNVVASSVAEVNTLTNQVANLNITIRQFEAAGRQAHDLRSQRTALVEQLALIGPVRTYDLADGSQRILFAGHAIVEGSKARDLSVVPDPVTGFNQVHMSMGSTTIDITSTVALGSMGSAIEERDTILAGTESQLDDLAFTIHNDVNALHVSGFGQDGLTGRNFFGNLAGPAGAAAALSLDALIDGNPDAVAAATTLAGLPGDNSNASALAALSSSNSMSAATQTFTEFYSTLVSELGHSSKQAQQETIRSEMQLEASQNVRDQTSAVSMEEEALDLVRFQDSYQAAARVMSAANEMLDELLAIV